MRDPSIFWNGSGSRELAGNEPGVGTGHSAPSSSTEEATARVTGAASAAGVVPVTTATAAVTMAVTATMTTARRSLEVPDVVLTRALLPETVTERCDRYTRMSHCISVEYTVGSCQYRSDLDDRHCGLGCPWITS